MSVADRKRAALGEAINKAGDGFTMNAEFQNRFLELVQNEFFSRGAFIQRWMDARRNYNRECGYPETYEITSEKWQEYYERHPIAARVVELMPSECWQITPDVYEDEDPNVMTPFEQAFKDLAVSLRGVNSHYKPEEEVVHPIWETCRRADILSGVGQFGLILLGFDDGLSMNQPVEGWQEPAVGAITWNERQLLMDWVRNADEFPPKKEKRVTEKENMQSKKTLDPVTEGTPKPKDAKSSNGKKLDPEPKGPSMPSPSAFQNTANPQQSQYHDPMDTQELKDIKDQGTQQPEPGKFKTDGSHKPKVAGQTDIQPFQDGEEQGEQPDVMPQAAGGRKLLYVRVFPENLVQIMQYEQNMSSPRFGQPTMYRITINDPMQQYTGVGMPLSTIEVHYSRVIHIADVGANAGSSEIFAAPRMRPVLNNLLDLQKIYGACGEGYWKNAFATLAAETHPQLGGDVTLDVESMREQMKKWRDSLDRVLAATGVTWKTISPQVVDPNSYVQNELTAICIKLACPMRVFMGSEQGVLAASQDAIAWGFRVNERRKNYLTPRLIVPLIDRLINVGVLPAPERFVVHWNEEQKLTPGEQAQIAGAMTGAMASYISGQVDQMMEPLTWFVEVCGWERNRAQAAIDATMEHITKQQEQQAMQGQQMIDPMTGQPMEQDEMGQFIDPNTGEPAQTDEFGKPVVMDPNTGQPMPAQQQSPQESQGPLGAETAEAQQGQGMSPEQEGGAMPMEGEQPQEGVDPDTGLEVDPATGRLIDPDTGNSIDKETGDVYSPEGEVLGNLFDQQEQQGDEQEPGQQDDGEEQEIPQEGELPQQEGGDGEDYQGVEGGPPPADGTEDPQQGADNAPSDIDPEYGFPIEPGTGYILNPQGYKLDKETGDVYTPDGQLYGNLNDDEEEEEPQEGSVPSQAPNNQPPQVPPGRVPPGNPPQQRRRP
jgi:hypothetical protein